MRVDGVAQAGAHGGTEAAVRGERDDLGAGAAGDGGGGVGGAVVDHEHPYRVRRRTAGIRLTTPATADASFRAGQHEDHGAIGQRRAVRRDGEASPAPGTSSVRHPDQTRRD